MKKISKRGKGKEKDNKFAERWLAETYIRRYLKDLKKGRRKSIRLSSFKPFLN